MIDRTPKLRSLCLQKDGWSCSQPLVLQNLKRGLAQDRIYGAADKQQGRSSIIHRRLGAFSEAGRFLLFTAGAGTERTCYLRYLVSQTQGLHLQFAGSKGPIRTGASTTANVMARRRLAQCCGPIFQLHCYGIIHLTYTSIGCGNYLDIYSAELLLQKGPTCHTVFRA